MKLVLDHFYENPNRLRDLALGLEFTSRARNFPGSRSTRTVIPKEAARVFKTILGVRLDGPANRIPYNGCFQLMKATDGRRAYVHADTSAQWAGLVYLSAVTLPEGGTSFFKHKSTGLTRMPDSRDFSAKEFAKLKQLLRDDGARVSRWIELDRVGFVYNRLVLYDAQLFHRNGKTWGKSVETGRLTHNFFI